MLAAITYGGRIRRSVARTGGVTVALIGHLAVLFALGYQQTSETILGEQPAAIAVDIVSAPPPQATIASRQPTTADDDSRQNRDSIDPLQTTAVERHHEPPPAPHVAATPDPAVTTAFAGKRSSSIPKAPGRQISSAKLQGAPSALASAPNPIAAPDLQDSSSAATTGAGAADSNVPSAWKSRLLSHLDHYKRYPDAARAQGHEGTALLSFGMNRDGHVLTYYLVRSSGCPELDDEVLAMIERASPLPAAPPGLNEQVVQLVVPVRFRM
ncbi:MAG: hypothetical protein BGN91_01570 [Nitrobacter sp. 62-13]|jgi:protein TonB|uniref:energy transducer TonB n=1 Tax=Nitrobacter sp. 62-13 TaxID=1895797 RepID=UPI00095FFBD2|nr:energy transducer TonB [Nitrobacter sp. 62-13]OJU26469.1 MAG: hypothetical protein BGN91_01570 [Nitrobacter sp. 62-13]